MKYESLNLQKKRTMILKSLNYFENKDKDNYWEIKDVYFSKQNIVVGLNATGKTRLTNIISNLAAILSTKVKLNGNWFLTFENGSNIVYTFNLQINNGLIEREEIKENDKILLQRENGSGKIFSKKENKMHSYNPPIDELTLNVRRDTADYPFLEDFINWSKNLKGYSFSGVKNDQITIPHKPEGYIDTLTTVPYILKQASDDDKVIMDKIIKDLNDIGYPLEKVFAKEQPIQPNLQNIFTVAVKEMNLNCETEQATISNGMFRAICLIVIIEYLLKIEKTSTIIIDDLGEGLDFDRSTKLTKLLFRKTQESDLQLIITSNDRFLINSVEMQNINYLERRGHIVQAYNYQNNKDIFDKFLLSGLNNFDFINPSLSHLKN